MSEIVPLNPPASCLLWDIDGTLIDSTQLIVEALDFVYRKYFQRTLPGPEIQALIGTPLKKQVRIFGDLETYEIHEAEILADFIQYYEARRDREQILPEIIGILREGKRRGFLTGVVTSKNLAELDNTLPRLGIQDSLDIVVSADDVPIPKPAPDGMLFALKQLQIPEALCPNAVYIGDTIHDLQATRAAGIRAVAVLWGAGTQESLTAEQPAALAKTSSELRRLLFGD